MAVDSTQPSSSTDAKEGPDRDRAWRTGVADAAGEAARSGATMAQAASGRHRSGGEPANERADLAATFRCLGAVASAAHPDGTPTLAEDGESLAPFDRSALAALADAAVSELRQFLETHDDLSAECERLRALSRRPGERSSNDAIAGDVARLRAQLSTVQSFAYTYLRQSQRSADKAADARKQTERQRARHERDLQRAREEAAALKAQIEDMASSTSWRLTRPIRALQSVALSLPHGWSDRAALRALRRSNLLDAQWYAERYPDVAAAGWKPAKHYLKHGAAEGRDPGPLFSTERYLADHPDVRENGLNPLVHYVQFGRTEGRSTHAAEPNVSE